MASSSYFSEPWRSIIAIRKAFTELDWTAPAWSAHQHVWQLSTGRPRRTQPGPAPLSSIPAAELVTLA
jgi:hypothetical protein